MLPGGVTGKMGVEGACLSPPAIADGKGDETGGGGEDGEGLIPGCRAGVMNVGLLIGSIRLPDWLDFSVMGMLSALARLLTMALALG